MTRLQSLAGELDGFLQELGKFYHEESILESTFFEHPEFQEILKCTDRLQKILDKLEESQLPNILKAAGPIKSTR